jgi:ubiquinone/menaquinone biosynthesis methyltransferase
MTLLHDDHAKLALIRDVGFARYFSASRRRDCNRQFFDGLAEKYDATNVLHSFGTKSRFDRLAIERLPIRSGARILDLCTGTADIAILIAERYPDARITAIDASPRMLEVARRKAARHLDRIELVEGDALALGVPDAYFDGAVISFGLRNLESLQGGLRELRRVVKPGGFVSSIDQGKPRSALFRIAMRSTSSALRRFCASSSSTWASSIPSGISRSRIGTSPIRTRSFGSSSVWATSVS